jgi:hypothetical protein
MYDSSGVALVWITLLERGICIASRDLNASVLNYEEGDAGKVGTCLIRSRTTEIQICGLQGKYVASLSGGDGVLALRDPNGAKKAGIRNLQLSADCGANFAALDGMLVFPFSIPTRSRTGIVDDVFLAGPVPLAPRFWDSELLRFVRQDTALLGAAGCFASRWARNNLATGQARIETVVAAESSVFWCILRALERISTFVRGPVAEQWRRGM